MTLLPSRLTRAPLPLAGLLAVAFAATAFACAGSAREGSEPEATLASSVAAQREYRSLQQQWLATDPDARVALGSLLTAFVQRHPTEAPSRRVRLYLAWVSLKRNRIADAERWLDLADTGPSGSAADLLAVLRAAITLEQGQAETAYERLHSLQGSLVDPDDRLLCLDRLVAAALAAGRYREAVVHVLELAAQSARRHRERVWRSLATRLDEVPLPALEHALKTLTADGIESTSAGRSERVAAVTWLRRQIRSILARRAIDQRDVELAQRLVAQPREDGDRGQSSELLQLATEGDVVPSVRGRTLGLALDLRAGLHRQRALEVAAGISLTLDAWREADDPVRLETRPVEAVQGGLTESLARLASAGATLLAAGVDVEGAREAIEFATLQRVPVLLLYDPALDEDDALERAYVIGSSSEAANSPLVRRLSEQHRAVTLVGSSDTPCPDVGSTGGDADWAKAGGAVVFLAGADCARNVLMDLARAGRRLTLGIGLDALPLLGDELEPHSVWATSAGSVPLFAGRDSEPALRRFRELKGRSPGFYEALGHDVAHLARLVIPASASLDDDTAASEVHRRVADALDGAKLDGLWTTDSRRMSPKRRIIRTFSLVHVDGASRR